MKKLIAILAIGSMFIFVSVQCALTNNNQLPHRTSIQAKNAVISTKHKTQEKTGSSKIKGKRENSLKDDMSSKSLLSD